MEKIAPLTPSLSVAPQIAEQDVPILAACGFRSLMNNRPDGEAEGQPAAAAIEAAARRHGLGYRHVPVASGRIADADVAAFADALAELPGPVVAFCRTGTRSASLWALAEASRFDPEAILKTAAAAGYELAGLRPRLEGRARDAAPTRRPEVKAFFDRATYTVTYVVADPATRRAAIVDPVLDYDPKSGRTRTASADAVLAHIAEAGLAVDAILETHVHADHLTAAPSLKRRLGGGIPVAIGEHVATVQHTFKRLFNAEPGFATDGSQFDRLFKDGEEFRVGSLEARVLHTPGHTPACVTYVIGDAAFVGDTLFMPDYGTARCDFPGGDAATLYRSIRKILSLPPATRLFLCHDYMPGGREVRWETSIAEQRAANIHVHDGVSEDEFVRMRTERDRTLEMPTLILPAVQVNMRAGAFPPAEENGVSYLKIPLDAL